MHTIIVAGKQDETYKSERKAGYGCNLFNIGRGKPNQREQIKICASTLEEYFPDDLLQSKGGTYREARKEWHENRLKIMEGTGDYMNKIRIYDLIWIRNLILWHGRAFTAKMWGKI